MKNIKTFEGYTVVDTESNNPIKRYGEEYPLLNLRIGEKVIYLGARFIVDKVDEYSLVLRSDEDGSTMRVNQNMFNQRGFIPSR